MKPRHADAWHLFAKDDDYLTHKISVMRTRCEEIDRDPDEILISAGIPRREIPETIEKADTYYDMGIREFTMGFNGPDYDLEQAKGWLEWRDSKN